jgi:hypothetical protein
VLSGSLKELVGAGRLPLGERAMSKASKSFKIGRNAETGRLVQVKRAQQHPKTHVVEHMPKPGHGTARKQK